MGEGMDVCALGARRDACASRGNVRPPRKDGVRPRDVGAAVGVSLLLVSCMGRTPHERPPPTVGVVTIQPQPVILTTELPGRTNPYEIADVRPQVGGIIKARLFAEGSVVRAGQVLYQIEPAPFQAAYDQARAQLASAEATVVDAKLKAERLAALVKLNSAARQDADDAEAASKEAEATVQQDRAALEAARINLAFTRITAPITGRIGISTVTKGALVTASQTTALDTIQQLDPIYVDVTQSVAQVTALRQSIQQGHLDTGGAAEAHITLDNGVVYPFAGRLEFTDITVDPTTDAVTLRAVFPNPSGLLLPGMFVRATVVEGVNPAGLLAPEQGVSRDQKGEPTALVVNAKGVAEQRQLQVNGTVGNKWLVTAGLSAGDRLIVESGQPVEPGTAVRAVPADSQR